MILNLARVAPRRAHRYRGIRVHGVVHVPPVERLAEPAPDHRQPGRPTHDDHVVNLVGVDVEPPEPFHGRSFADALRGKTEKTDNDCAVSACMLRIPKEGKIPAGATTPVLYTDDWAYVPIGPKWQRQLFAIKDDPYCENNVAANHPDVVKKLHDRLAKWLKDLDAPPEALAVFEEDALA